MTTKPRKYRLRRRIASLAVVSVTAAGFAGCSAVGSSVQNEQDAAVATAAAADSIWDASAVHVVSLEVDEDEFQAMVETYEENGEKEWLTADVTIDGETFRDVGVRLKGNSSLQSVDTDADPADLPWLIDLDKFVDGQSLDGSERFVVRSNNSETALNEAVALDLLQEAGLASQEAVASRFSVNGSDARLRLLVQDLDDRWDDDAFDSDGTLYKSEAGGDWSYRGDDAASYTDVFDIEAGTEDYAPLTEFLQWLEDSSDEEFASGLSDRLDVEAFAAYLAFEDLIGNFDDIEGPGNNSYLRWDADAQKMTVVAWDHNLAFGGMSGMSGMGGMGGDDERLDRGGEPPEGFEPPDGGELPEGFEPPEDMLDGERPDGRRGGGPGGSNILAERFRANAEFAALYDSAVERLQAELFDDGTAEQVLETWTDLLEEQATDVVGSATIDKEAEQIESYFDGHAAEDTSNAGQGITRDGGQQ